MSSSSLLDLSGYERFASFKYETSTKKLLFCPRSYHRKCVPVTAELISVQRTEPSNKYSKYPDFRFDAITCCWNDEDKATELRLNPVHPKPKDLQFGRDDVRAGIFKWNLWNGTIAEFYRLHDDPFSIDIKLFNDYESRLRKQRKNPWPKNFKKIQKSRYHKDYIRSNAKNYDYGCCQCDAGCLLDGSCSNYSMDIECNSEN
eukprot:TRINITY_DN1507_c0_g1_i2.p1 TRINITY_DN1507_c0_g1~~TRINITY_DN1507_c0_g1_i2.p1  ORF type:complete len:202 (+),score=3.70 TRINITY_DN1507_c0_g1_i2:350-955(+)